MMSKVQKWGKSLGVRIPKALAQGAQVEAGMAVDVTILDGQLVISPHRDVIGYDLAALVAQITPENIHAEFSSGKPVGREIW
jgi:antitoxin MazE